MSKISFQDFKKIDLRVGTIISIDDFPEANKPAYKLVIDFGPLGIKKSSAQITKLYKKNNLLNKQIIANINFNDKQIANFKSQCLVIGATMDNFVVILNPAEKVPNGSIVQ